MTIQKSTSKLKIAFAKDAEVEGAKLLKEILKDHPQFIELVPSSDNPKYHVKVADQSFQLTLPDEERLVFRRVNGVTRESAIDFIVKIETVAKWVQVFELYNPASNIQDHEIKIELFKIDQPGNYEDNAPARKVDWQSPALFSYEYLNGEWQGPAFRLKITNTGNRLLWVHALYMSKDFNITDQLLPKQELKPDETTWLTDVSDGSTFRTIPLQVEEASLATGVSEIKEFIKLFISTDELAIHRFNQEGLQQDISTGPKRGISSGIQLTASDWTTREIELIIQRPIEETTGAESDEVITPEPIPPSAPAPKLDSPPVSSAAPKSSSPSVVEQLKNWFRVFTKSKPKNKKSEPFPTTSRKIETDDPFSKKENEKIHLNHEDESEEAAAPPLQPKSSITEEFDELLKEPETQKTDLPDALKTTKSEQVDCSVYAPPAAQKGDDVFIQVWLHLPQLSQKVKTMAMEFDEEASQRAFQSLKIPLEKGDELSLVLETKGIELNENVQHITWNGTLQSVQFVASIPEDYAKNKVIFTLRVFKKDLPIGHVKFILKVTSEPVEATPQPLGTEAKRYKKAFISYSSKDRNEVLKRVQMLDKLEIEFFQDLINLNPGERWEKKLYDNIDDSDVFFLFWSSAAKESKWVLQELEYAIKLKKGDENHPPFIKPVPLEGPPIVPPPEQLGHMHFNDRILYFILKS